MLFLWCDFFDTPPARDEVLSLNPDRLMTTVKVIVCGSEARSHPASLRNVCFWNPATILWGHTSNHTERSLFQLTAPAEVPANSQHQIAEDVSKWALWCQVTPAFESSQQRLQTSRSRDKPNHCALFKFLTQRNYESKTMVVVSCHLVWVCYTATDNHYNCFKAIESHGKVWEWWKGMSKVSRRLTWL